MPELTVAQAYVFDKRFGWLWYLGATRSVRNRLGVRFLGEPWKVAKSRGMSRNVAKSSR